MTEDILWAIVDALKAGQIAAIAQLLSIAINYAVSNQE